MIVRNKSGEYRAGDVSSLLEFLGVGKEAAGVQKVAHDVELIASVPFHLTADTEDKGIAWTLSTFDLDRYGERVDPAGWDFKKYLQNPVVEWAHRYDIPAIGKMENLSVDDEGLHGFVFFNSKEFDPFGWSIGERVKAGVIRAGSVGFRVMEIEIPDRKTSEDGTCLIFRKQELLEFSICNVPANPFALSKVKNRTYGSEELEVRNDKSDFRDQISHGFWGGLINF